MDPQKYEQMLDILARSSSNFDERVGQRFVDVSGVNGYYNGDGINVGLPVGQLAQMGIDAITGAGRPRGFVSTDELAEQFANVADDVFRNPQTGEPDPNRRMFIRGFSGTIDATGQNITYAADRQMTVREFRDSFLAEVARANGGQVDPEVIAAFDRELAERGFGPQTVAPIQPPNRANVAAAGADVSAPAAPQIYEYPLQVMGFDATLSSPAELSAEELATIQAQAAIIGDNSRSQEDRLAAFTSIVGEDGVLNPNSTVRAMGQTLTVEDLARRAFENGEGAGQDYETQALAALAASRAAHPAAPGAAPTTQFVANPALGTMTVDAITALPLGDEVAALLTAPTITGGAENTAILPGQRISLVFDAMSAHIDAARDRELTAEETAAGTTREQIVQAARTEAVGVFQEALENEQLRGNLAHIYQNATPAEREMIDNALSAEGGLVEELGEPMGTNLRRQVEALQADRTRGAEGEMSFFEGLILMFVEIVGRDTPLGQQLLGLVDPEHRAPAAAAPDAPAAPAAGADVPDAGVDTVDVTGSRAPELAGADTPDIIIASNERRAFLQTLDPESYTAVLAGPEAEREARLTAHDSIIISRFEDSLASLPGAQGIVVDDNEISKAELQLYANNQPVGQNAQLDALLAANGITRDAALQTASADLASVGDMAGVNVGDQLRSRDGVVTSV